MMKISDIGGEVALIKLIEKEFGAQTSDVLPLALGDDAALLHFCGDRLMIVTTDLLIEGTHFRRDIIDAYSLGWKSVAVNISDVAAMGGTPTFTFVSIAVPDIEVDYVREVYQGMWDCCKAYQSELAGGDTNVSSSGIVINVAQLGLVDKGKQTLRSTARPRDMVVVTGYPGESRAGLELLLATDLDTAWRTNEKCVQRHLRPEPRVMEAQTASGTGKVLAAMDISDGLATDLKKMCAAGGLGARVYAEKIPVSDELRDAAQVLGMDPLEIAISGGEDYELLYAARDVEMLNEVLAVPVTAVGEFNDTGDVTVVWPDGTETSLDGGWQHFKR